MQINSDFAKQNRYGGVFMNKKSNFSGRIGFVLAAAGSAVGLGNLWRFPYLAAKYGGGTFLLVYIILALTFGFSLMITEIAIGRKTGGSVISAFSSLSKKFSFVGYLAALVPVIIFPYYCVIGGWVMKYTAVYFTGQTQAAAAGDFFTNFIIGIRQPLGFFFIFVAITAIVVSFGVEKGIEKLSKILMPILVVLSVGIAVVGLTADGALEGVKYYLVPDFSKLSLMGVCAALGQLFYSMSLAMGIMITYGSYMKKDEDIEKCVGHIEIFDTAIAFLAGLIIIPAVFVYSGGTPESLSAGPTLMFVTLPKIFANMQGGTIIGAAFFILVFFAALTSAISILETIVAFVMEKFKISRRKACIIITVIALAMGVPSALGYGVWADVKIIGLQFLDLFDFLSNSVIMPIVALATCIMVGYVIKPKAIFDEVESSGKFKRYGIYKIMIRYVGPIFLLLILITSILNTFGFISM